VALVTLAILAAGLGSAYAAWLIRRPYTIKPLTIQSGKIRLAASLYLPKRATRCPGVVLMHGTWPSVRLGYVFYADWFARHGIAVLTYDKRGNGQSTGEMQFTALHDLATDAAACWETLRRDPHIDPARVGFWGYSQGGAGAPLAATLVDAPAFVICLSGPGLRLGEQMLHYNCARLHGPGKAEAVKLRDRLWAYSRTGQGWDELYADLLKARRQSWYKPAGLPPKLEATAPADGTQPFAWRLGDLSYDPLPTLAQLRCPVLLQYGGKDTIVPAQESMLRIAALKEQHGLGNIEVKLYPLGSHAMAKPGMLPDAPGSFADGYLEDLDQWVGEHVVAQK
jgi:dienelactone hydrolase